MFGVVLCLLGVGLRLFNRFLKRAQQVQMTRLWDEQKRLRGDPAITQQAGLILTADKLPEPTRYWRVTRSCGFRRDAGSPAAAQKVSRMHIHVPLGTPEQHHARTGAEPRRDGPRDGQLPLL